MKLFYTLANITIICITCLLLGVRDKDYMFAILSIIGGIVLGIFQYKLTRSNDDNKNIKADVILRFTTVLSIVMVSCYLYEQISGRMIPDDIGDLVAIGVIAVGLGIMFYYYYIKPSK